MRLTGADFSTPVGELPLEAKTNYFLGNDPSAWHTDVPNFARVRYTDVHPGVDLVHYGNGRVFEYDLVVAPGANPDVVAMEWEGAESVEVDENGTLVDEGGKRRVAAGVAGRLSGRRRLASPVSGAFEGDRRRTSRRAPRCVRSGEATRDRPGARVLDVSGGNGWEGFRALAVDTAGSALRNEAYILHEFPNDVSVRLDIQRGWDVLVAKLSPSGNVLVYSTYLGGDGRDFAWGLAVDSVRSSPCLR
ncbi:MAG: hypothetical protein IPF82_16275 [Blastocatellia bacterium]|nr:hypothetical protein [Blastocatellia bacterium]